MTARTVSHPETLLREAGGQAKDLSHSALDQGQDLAKSAIERGQEVAHSVIDQGQDLAQTALEHGQELTERARQLPDDVVRGTGRLSNWVAARRRPLTYLSLGLTATVAVVGITRMAMASGRGDGDAAKTPLSADDGPLSQRAHDPESAYPSNDQPAVDAGEEVQRGTQQADEPVKAGDVIPGREQ